MYMMPCNHLWLVSWLRCCHSDSSIIKFPINLSPSEVVGPQPWLRIWNHLGTFTVNSEVLTYLVWSAAYTVRLFFFFFFSIYLAALGLSRSNRDLCCCLGDLVPWSGIEHRSLALEMWSLSPWTTREVPTLRFFDSFPGQSRYRTTILEVRASTGDCYLDPSFH